MISVEGLSVEFSAKPLFINASFVVNDRDRIALVGKNGAGKSTLLKILCGKQQPTNGVVSIPNDTTIGYLPQVMNLQDDTTVREEAQKAFASTREQKERIDRMNQQLAERTDYESDDYLALVERFTQEHERYMMMGAENYEAEIERTLIGLGFLRTDFDRPTSEFSGGWRMRIELAKILLQKPDVLLLDEPTNHLDINSKDILLEALKKYDGTVLFVSHDKYFIENLADRVLELGDGKATSYVGDYTYYLEKKAQQVAATEGASAAQTAPVSQPKQAQLSREESKQRKRDLKKLERELEQVMADLDALEQEVSRLNDDMAKPENYSDGAKIKELKAQLDAAESALETKTVRWEELESAIAELQEN